MAMNFSSFAVRLLAGVSTLQVLEPQGLNLTARRPAEPSVGRAQQNTERGEPATEKGRLGARFGRLGPEP